MTAFFTASAMCLLGLLGLRYSWSKPERSAILNSSAWLSILAGLILLGIYTGDRGIAVGLCMVMVAALVLIAREMVVGSEGGTREPKRSKHLVKPPKSITSGLRKVGTFLYLGLIQGVLAFLGALGVHELMILGGAEMSDSLVLALFVFPVFWAVIASYYLVGGGRLKKSAILMVVPTFGALLLIVGN